MAEAVRWKGAPTKTLEDNGRRLARWADLEIRQAGCGIMMRAKMSGFTNWWHKDETWASDPLDAIHDWLNEENDGTTD